MSAVEDRHYRTAESFLDALALYRAPWQPEPRDWLFRGQASEGWAMKPSAFRGTARWVDGGKGPRPDWSEQQVAERAIVKRFADMLDAQGLRLPEPSAALAQLLPIPAPGTLPPGFWATSELLPLIGLAQHESLPTRLLDFSRKPLIAAYFAAVEAAEWEHGVGKKPKGAGRRLCVWALRRRVEASDKSLRWDLSSPSLQIFEFGVPRSANGNLHLQSGRFVLMPQVGSGPHDQPTLEDYIAARHTPGPSPILVKLTLPHQQAPRLLKLVADQFVHGSTVYSGHQGARRATQEKALRALPVARTMPP